MATTAVKREKSAAELAELIRSSLNKRDLRIAVFAQPRSWRAKIYPDAGEKHMAELQAWPC